MFRGSVILAAGLAVAGCKDGGLTGPLSEIGTGRYQVTITVSQAGGTVVQGTLDLTVADDSTITGTKALTLRSGSGEGLEPLFEGGQVVGRVLPEGVSLGLNPLYADHNFFLEGDLATERLVGQFTHVGITGATEVLGTFEAVKRL